MNVEKSLKSGAQDLPYDMTGIAISSVNNLVGDLLRVVPHDFEYIAHEATLTTGTPTRERQLPNIVVIGAITKFDEEIKKKDGEWSFEGYISTTIEGEQVDIDLIAAFAKSGSISRLTLDLHLLNYTTGRVTQASALKFLYQYTPQSRLIPVVEHNNFPHQQEMLADFYISFLQNIPIS